MLKKRAPDPGVQIMNIHQTYARMYRKIYSWNYGKFQYKIMFFSVIIHHYLLIHGRCFVALLADSRFESDRAPNFCSPIF